MSNFTYVLHRGVTNRSANKRIFCFRASSSTTPLFTYHLGLYLCLCVYHRLHACIGFYSTSILFLILQRWLQNDRPARRSLQAAPSAKKWSLEPIPLLFLSSHLLVNLPLLSPVLDQTSHPIETPVPRKIDRAMLSLVLPSVPLLPNLLGCNQLHRRHPRINPLPPPAKPTREPNQNKRRAVLGIRITSSQTLTWMKMVIG